MMKGRALPGLEERDLKTPAWSRGFFHRRVGRERLVRMPFPASRVLGP